MTNPDPVTARPQPSPAALTSLLLGTASVLLPIVAGVPALFVGYRALYDVNASGGRITGRRLAVAGMALGGFTTVLAVIGFILLIFIHLAQKSRVAECQNNLRRLGLAVNVYQAKSADKVFPGAAVPNAKLPVADRLSWMTSILPYLDEAHPIAKKWQYAYESLDRQRAWNDPANDEARDTVIAVFLCPNHPTYDPPVRPAPTHYVGISGEGMDAVLLPLRDERAGFFGYDRVLRPSGVAAGMSYTLLSLETTSDNGPWIAAGFPTVRGVPDNVDRLVGFGAPFGGCHSGGMNALFVDGSVHFQNENIDPKVLRSLARIDRE